jgi:hypothetical protein
VLSFGDTYGCHAFGAPGKNLPMGSASESFPSSTCSITAVAVNILPSDPDWKIVSGVTATLCSRFA